MEVVRVARPAERARLEDLRAAGRPRLLMVPAGTPPPPPADCLEDWVQVPSVEAELRARWAALETRAQRHSNRPELDGDGVLRFRDAWVALPPVDTALATALLDRYGAVARRDSWSAARGRPRKRTRNALDLHSCGCADRLASLGLEIRTVRSRGYLLQSARPSDDGQAPA